MTEPTADELRRLLADTRTIAVLGAHPEAERPAHYVPAYMARQGYRVIAVNPSFAGGELWGEPIVATLQDLRTPIDLVNVFRRADQLPGHLDELLAMQPPPKVVWFQQGIRHDAVAERLRAAGVTVVQDRCLYVEHRRLGVGPVHA